MSPNVQPGRWLFSGATDRTQRVPKNSWLNSRVNTAAANATASCKVHFPAPFSPRNAAGFFGLCHLRGHPNAALRQHALYLVQVPPGARRQLELVNEGIRSRLGHDGHYRRPAVNDAVGSMPGSAARQRHACATHYIGIYRRIRRTCRSGMIFFPNQLGNLPFGVGRAQIFI